MAKEIISDQLITLQKDFVITSVHELICSETSSFDKRLFSTVTKQLDMGVILDLLTESTDPQTLRDAYEDWLIDHQEVLNSD